MARIQKLKEKVLATLAIWRRYYSRYIIVGQQTGTEVVKLTSLFELPREDNIKRIRAHIQNDLGKWLPTSLEVAKQRKINEATWHAYMANPHLNKML